ncbi:MAG TPA: hypothetical protein EYG67_05445 [Campylobacterales bacterium]|nr:hypothetical protein [Campylobacterales bacterium]HIP41304.1 hypothetical protein [Campylobacterales bacterium]
MRVVFDKIGHSPKPFELDIENISFKGTLTKRGYHRVRLEGELDGSLELICDRCGDGFTHNMTAPLALTLSDEVIETEDDLDIIEFIDGVIDLKFIIQSEIASVQNSYHNCIQCENDDEAFEKEF